MSRFFAAPSFSLGLDFDLGEAQQDPIPNEISESNPVSYENMQVEDSEDEGFDNVDSARSSSFAVQKFKRLRRGPRLSPIHSTPICPNSNSSTVTAATFGETGDFPFLDDEIEDFSSHEDDDFTNIPPKAISSTKQTQSICNSLKKSLHGSRVLSTNSSAKLKRTCILPSSDTGSSIVTEFNGNRVMFPKLTISPLRKIQFSDSDTDNSPTQERQHNNPQKVDFSKNRNRLDDKDRPPLIPNSNILLSNKNVNKRKNISPIKHVNFATPAFDNFCEEYYDSANKSNFDQFEKGKTTMLDLSPHSPCHFTDRFESLWNDGMVKDAEQQWDLPDPKPPSYQYFFHVDARISKLVKARLFNFVPLSTQSPEAGQPFGTESINYMCQFGSKEASTSAPRVSVKNRNARSRNTKKNTVDVNATDGQLDESENWINPRSCQGQMDYASHQTSGHWYTEENGIKVYVTKDGKELKGRNAYRQYKKDNSVAPPRRGKSKKKIVPKNTKARRRR